jgi:hypothetical protein
MDYTPILVTVLLSFFSALTVGLFFWRLWTGKAHFNNFSADRTTNPKEFWTIQAFIVLPALVCIAGTIWWAGKITL